MAAGYVTKTVGDGNGGTFTARFWSSDGTTGGLLYPAPVQTDVNGNAIDFTATSPVAQVSVGYDVGTTITRPANVTAYTAGDVLGGALDLGVLGATAGPVVITSVQLEADISAIPSGQTSWVLYLYNVTPPSAIADNGVFSLPSGDRFSFLGSIPIAALVNLSSTLYVEANAINKQVRLAGTHLFGYLVTVGGFTPAANSEVYKLTIHTVAV